MQPKQRVTEAAPKPDDSRSRLFWNRVDDFRLRSRWASTSLLIAAAGFGLVLIGVTGKVVVAQILGDSFQPALIRQAIAIDPVNPVPRFQMGKLLLLTGNPAEQHEAKQEFRAAIHRNPQSATYWSGLGTACYVTGDQSCADEAFRQAQRLAPNNPEIVWQSAINDVVSGQQKAAIEEAKNFLRLQPDGLVQTFQLLTRGFEDPLLVWRGLLDNSSDATARLKYLEFLASTGRIGPANALWQQLAAQKTPVSPEVVAAYVDQLMANAHYTESAAVWSYARSSIAKQNEEVLTEPNLIFNGSFEHQPLNSGLDWHYAHQPYVEVSFSDLAAKGGHALKSDFTVPQNTEYELAYQFVPVEPNHSYHLSALVKTQSISSDSGPRLRVLDPRCNACLDTSTEGTTGTTEWHPITTQFSTGPTTDMVRLSVWRPRSRVYPTEITGQLWLDDVSLVPANTVVSEKLNR
jgi:tetratricopeptide (TPR) repeat protein